MNIGQTAVTNAANLSFFMVNLSHYLLALEPLEIGEGIVGIDNKASKIDCFARNSMRCAHKCFSLILIFRISLIAKSPCKITWRGFCEII
ncbi:MAG: hypothetical protein RMX99_030090, partial [Aulosira sp. DedVER01a]